MTEQVIFESISDIPAWIEAHPAVVGSASGTRSSDSWDRNLGMQGAIDMAADGGYWEEGAAKIMSAHTTMDELKREDSGIEIDMDVTGVVLDMDAFLSGDPECYENYQEDVQMPVIKIGVQQYTPGTNDERNFFNRGAALLSCIDELELLGIRVELWGCTSGVARGSKKKNDPRGIDMRTCLKRSQDQWSPSSVAFGLCHAAFGRRLGFRVVEAFQSCRDYVNSGHGLDFHNDRPVDSDFDCWFGYADMLEGHKYGSVKNALKIVSAEIKRQMENKDYANA